ncbi:MAG: hypothetical protein OXH06_13375 [Gemmatimonadetes bacterium]|nr:hypothetical protein [Gemmatimonadota bacterium]
MSYKWITLMGDFTIQGNDVTFNAGLYSAVEPAPVSMPPQYRAGKVLSNQQFGGGSLRGTVTIQEQIDESSACDFLLAYSPATRGFLSAGVGGEALASVRYFANQWHTVGSIGTSSQLEANRAYDLSVTAKGSQVSVSLDGVSVLSVNLPFILPNSQTGIFCAGPSNIHITNFAVTSQKTTAFVVMQFTPPFNELYTEVIKPVCAELGIVAHRADETFGPGIVIADIARQISEANIVIADVTPENANVYYEVGYAHAINKPTILIAEKKAELPFDVAPFRVLFYEDSIGGKRVVEEGLRNHLKEIQATALQLQVW